MRSSVLLPQPDGPTIATNSPCGDRQVDAVERVRLASRRGGRSWLTPRDLDVGRALARARSRRRTLGAATRRVHSPAITSARTRWCGTRSTACRSASVAVLLEQRERLVPVRLRAPADAALRVRRVEQLDVDHQLVERATARLRSGFDLHARRRPRRSGFFFASSHDFAVARTKRRTRSGLFLMVGFLGHDRHADDVGAVVGDSAAPPARRPCT